jgi:hypothetical protein
VAANGGSRFGGDAYAAAVDPGYTLDAHTASFQSEYGLDVTTTKTAITVLWPMGPHTWRLRYSELLDGIDTSGFVPAALGAGERVNRSRGTAVVRFTGPSSVYSQSGPLLPINTVEVSGDELRLPAALPISPCSTGTGGAWPTTHVSPPSRPV